MARWGPPFVGAPEPESTYFLSAYRNRQSLALDLRTQAGAQELTTLVRPADVLVENFRSGVLDRLGFNMERLGAYFRCSPS